LEQIDDEWYLDTEDLCGRWSITAIILKRIAHASRKFAEGHECRIPDPDLRGRSNSPRWKVSRMEELDDWYKTYTNRSTTPSGRSFTRNRELKCWRFDQMSTNNPDVLCKHNKVAWSCGECKAEREKKS
jgi:hypothetical protein